MAHELRRPAPAWAGALAIDETFLYWATPQESGSVLRARKDANAVLAEVVAEDVRLPFGVAVDDKAVCWSEWTTGKIWCVAK